MVLLHQRREHGSLALALSQLRLRAAVVAHPLLQTLVQHPEQRQPSSIDFEFTKKTNAKKTTRGVHAFRIDDHEATDTRR